MKKMFAVVAVLVLAAVVFVACGGSDSSGPAAATYTTTAQASTSSAAAANMGTSGLSVTNGAMGLSSIATGNIGKAKRMNYVAKKTANAGAAMSPKQRTIRAKYDAIKNGPTMKKVFARARAMKRSTVNSTFYCSGINNDSSMGTITYTGTDNSSDAGITEYIWDLTITFNNCKDTDGSSYWYAFNGSIRDTYREPVSASSNVSSASTSGSSSYSETISNFKITAYNGGFTTGTIIEELAMNGTFSGDNTWTVANSGASGSVTGKETASGTFSGTVTDPQAGTFTFSESFNGMSDSWSGGWDDAKLSETWSDTISGAYSAGFTVNNQNYLTFTLTFAGFGMKETDVYDASGYYTGENSSWINGTVSMAWTGEVAKQLPDCLSGSYTFKTADATPIHAMTWDGCPDSGIMSVNNAVIKFGSDAGTGNAVSVTVGTNTTNYPDCFSFFSEGDACVTSM